MPTTNTPMKMRTRTIGGLFLAFFLALQARPDELSDRLFDAAQKGDAATVRALLAKGVDVNTKFRYGTTALFYAAQRGHLEVVQILLDHGADLNTQETMAGETPLVFAAWKGQAGVVKILLDKGADANPALEPAVILGGVETVKALLGAKGLKPETLSEALGTATQAGRNDIAELLRKAGATPPDPAREFQADPETLKAYAGTYKTHDGVEFNFAVKDGKLTGGNIFDDPTPLKAVNDVTFRLPGFGESKILFTVEGSKVAGFVLKQRRGDMVFQKVEQK